MLTNSQIIQVWTNSYTSNVITNVLTNIAGTGTAPIWQTVFFDDFNRADGNLGVNYILSNSNSTTSLLSNMVFVENTNYVYGSGNNSYYIILYSQPITNNRIRLSFKLKTLSFDGNGFNIGLGNGNRGQYDILGMTIIGSGFTPFGLNPGLFLGGTGNYTNMAFQTLPNTFYKLILEINRSSSNLIGEIKDDSDNSIVLGSVTLTNQTLLSILTNNLVTLSFMYPGNVTNYQIYYDDFKIEKFE